MQNPIEIYTKVYQVAPFQEIFSNSLAQRIALQCKIYIHETKDRPPSPPPPHMSPIGYVGETGETSDTGDLGHYTQPRAEALNHESITIIIHVYKH